LCHGRLTQHLFDHGHRIVQPSMERAKALDVFSELHWALVDAFHWLYRVHDIKHAQLIWEFGQNEASVESALGTDKSCPNQLLHEL
jgi:hypothetical protein